MYLQFNFQQAFVDPTDLIHPCFLQVLSEHLFQDYAKIQSFDSAVLLWITEQHYQPLNLPSHQELANPARMV